jgi:hypothetical protein
MPEVYNTFFTHKVSAGTNSFTGTITTTKRLYQPANQPWKVCLFTVSVLPPNLSLYCQEQISFQGSVTHKTSFMVLM